MEEDREETVVVGMEISRGGAMVWQPGAGDVRLTGFFVVFGSS